MVRNRNCMTIRMIIFSLTVYTTNDKAELRPLEQNYTEKYVLSRQPFSELRFCD